MVAHLTGQVDIDLDGKIDSFKGGIRTTFANIPDLPVSRFMIVLPGGKHGLLQASTNLCSKPVKGIIRLKGQNGKKANRHVRIKTPCGKKRQKKHNKHKRSGGKKSKTGHTQKGKRASCPAGLGRRFRSLPNFLDRQSDPSSSSVGLDSPAYDARVSPGSSTRERAVPPRRGGVIAFGELR